jgi:hypothetical protein
VRTIERRLSAIAWDCAQRGQPLDRADRHIAEVMSGIRRRHARPPDQKEAVFAEDLMRMVETLDHGLRAGLPSQVGQSHHERQQRVEVQSQIESLRFLGNSVDDQAKPRIPRVS